MELKPLVSEIIGFGLVALNPDDKYSLGKKETLRQTIQFQLSNKLTIFSQVFPTFPIFRFNFEHFEM